MKLRLMLCPILMSLATLARAAEPPKLEIRRFSLLPSIEQRRDIAGDDYREYFEQLGVEWPEGSSIQFHPASHMLVVKNTEENLSLLKELLAIGRQIRLMVEVQVDFIEFKMEVVDQLARSGNLSAASLLALWREGGAKLICTPRVVTKSSQEAILKGVTEYIYPTEYKVATPSSTNEPRPAITSAVVEPAGFEMREVGVILQCVPEIDSDGNMIDIMLNPQMVYPPVWKNYGSAHEAADGRKESLPMEQPFFPVHSICVSVSVANGATVLIGGGMNNPDGDKTVFAFLTARLLDTEGNPIKAVDGPQE